MKRIFLLGILITILAVQVSWSAVPETMSYQGYLTNASGTAVTDGNYSLTFSIYDVSAGGSALWTETHGSVATVNGIFNVILGSNDALNIAFDKQYWLGIKVGGGSELTPRIKLTSSPYSLGGDFWKLTGNAGTSPPTNFLGTTDDTPLELWVNNLRAFRLEPASSPNIIAGYYGNNISSGLRGATISGGGASGHINSVTQPYGTVGGGHTNTASGFGATVGGGTDSIADADYATISGGGPVLPDNPATGNRVFDNYGTVGGGGNNGAGSYNSDAEDAWYATVGGGRSNKASDDYATVGGGWENKSLADYATISGGTVNRVYDNYGTVGGGWNNGAGSDNGDAEDAWYATVGGGRTNKAKANYTTVGGGAGNEARAIYATVGGGWENKAFADYATISGGGLVDPDDLDTGNRVFGSYGTVSGGGDNRAGWIYRGVYATVGGGRGNQAMESYSTVGGGDHNVVTDNYGTVGGGGDNMAGNGGWTMDDSIYATVGGGSGNKAEGGYTTVGGGGANLASGAAATVPGGWHNAAVGNYSMAGGFKAKANHNGCFVWSDAPSWNSPEFASTNNHEFAVRCTGGVRFVTGIDGSGDPTSGMKLNPGGSTWWLVSDRNAKENFVQVDSFDILKRLTSVPIETWNYKSQDPAIRHIGPMAQDIKAAFGMGSDGKYISSLDLDGVALAAIQGLYELVKEKDAEIAALESRLAALEAIVDK